MRIARREAEVVQDSREHSDALARDRAPGVEQSELMRQVEVGDWFVKQKSLAFMNRPGGLDLRHNPRNLHPPLLTAGQGCVGLRRQRKRIRRRETLLDDPGTLSYGDPADTVDPQAHDLIGQKGRETWSLTSSLRASARGAAARNSPSLRPRKELRQRSESSSPLIRRMSVQLARAMGPIEDRHAPCFDIRGTFGVDQRAAPRAVAQLSRRHKGAQTPRPSPRRINSQRKNGALIAVVRTPIGISRGRD